MMYQQIGKCLKKPGVIMSLPLNYNRKKPKEVQAGALCSVMRMDCVKVINSLTTLTASNKKDPEARGFCLQSF